jgi:hypothetical protein
MKQSVPWQNISETSRIQCAVIAELVSEERQLMGRM